MDDECQSMRPWPVPKQTFDGIHTFWGGGGALIQETIGKLQCGLQLPLQTRNQHFVASNLIFWTYSLVQ